jgi:DNA-binding NtrC family response regulator
MLSKSAGMGSLDKTSPTWVITNHVFIQSTSPAMSGIEHVISEIAPTDIPILLVGESGTGKEMVALRIHQLSRRRNEPFVKVSCAALTAEFFDRQHYARDGGDGTSGPSTGGTVFLDDVHELTPICQSKLLHVLPDGGVPQERWLGERVISATSRNLEEELRAGRFREELYYRLDGACLRLPPLRHRKEDIPVLVDFFLAKYAAAFGRAQPVLCAATLQSLADYSWPGNIRELENAVRKIVALGDEHAVVADLGPSHAGLPPRSGFAEKLSLKQTARAASQQAERELILKVLTRTRWNRKRAAQDLQISYKALLYKLKQFGLDHSADSEAGEENPGEH